MARTKFPVEVLTPEGEVFSDEVEMLSTRTSIGSIGVLANHEPVLAMLEPTELRLYRSESEIVRFAQAEGYLQFAENRALVLVEEAIAPEQIDRQAFEAKLADARKAAQGAAPAYMYLLEWETTAARGKLRAPHAVEIPLVFDNVDKALSFMGRDNPQSLAEQMSEAWLAFARTGNPSTAALPDWPTYDTDRRATMVFNHESRVVEDPYAAVRRALHG